SFYVRREGHEPVVARDGSEALALFGRESFDLVLLDVMMPGRNGFEVCEAMRDADADMPIVLLSAKGDIVDKAMGFGAGADDYVTKPFDPAELMLRVNSCIRRSQVRGSKHPERVRLDDLTVSVQEREVTVRGERVSLTAKELAVLCFMAEHAGMVLTAAQILDAVWGADYVGDAGVVAVFVRKLREKVEEDPSHPRHILTEWGVGYRLV
ncbi:MAG: response regulator transcription factor, partial [Eggerthellaceae bacterium]|nr:response regulator transcription factor [Eggerthellaceae bacterium]